GGNGETRRNRRWPVRRRPGTACSGVNDRFAPGAVGLTEWGTPHELTGRGLIESRCWTTTKSLFGKPSLGFVVHVPGRLSPVGVRLGVAGDPAAPRSGGAAASSGASPCPARVIVPSG